MNDLVQLWKVPLIASDEVVKDYFCSLSSDEQDRANRFKFAHDRRRYVVARGTLRHLLGREFARSPQSITFCYSQYGKPSLSLASTAVYDFHFNLSHSGELALCILGGDRRVGVDIEIIRPIQRLDNMMERCLSKAEQQQVKAATEPLRAFLQRWTCKEAYLKAIGKGLSQSIKTVEVDATLSRLLHVPDDCNEGWHLQTVELPEDSPETYVGALVIAGKAQVQLNVWQHTTYRP